jgi:PAS domain S-box-containing protein
MIANSDFYSLQERGHFWYGVIALITLVSGMIYILALGDYFPGGGDIRTAYQVFIIPIVIASLLMGWRGLGVSVGIIAVAAGITVFLAPPEIIVSVLESSLIALGVSVILVFFSTSLKITKSRYDSLFEASPTPVLLIDDAACLKAMNASAVSSLGFSDRDRGLPFFRADGPLGALKGQYDDLRTMIEEHTEGTVEVSYLAENGQCRVLKVFVRPERQKDGRYIGSVLFIADISKEINALMALHEEQERFSQFFTAMGFGAGIYKKTPSGFEVVDMNPAACHANGVLRRQVVGAYLDTYGYFTDDADALRDVMDEVVLSGSPCDLNSAKFDH